MKADRALLMGFAVVSAAAMVACGSDDVTAGVSGDHCACGAGNGGVAFAAADEDREHDDSENDSVVAIGNASAEQGLYGNKSILWPAAAASQPATSRTDIAVCWENPESTSIGATPAARATWRDARRRALEESWARHARINFTGFGTCTSGAAGVHIVLCDAGADWRCPAFPASQAGGGYPAINGLNNGVRLNPSHGASIVVHEVGHALGFYHEEERGNTTSNLPTVACNPGASGWSNSNPASAGAYDVDSIMAYCSPPTAAPWLSPTDVAGIQRFYGRRIEGSLVSPRANCVAAHAAVGAGDQAFLWDCDEFANDQEYVDTTAYSTGDAWNLQLLGSAYCLEPWSNTAGSAVELYGCTSGSGNYDWRLQDMFVRGFGGLCLDVQGGSTAAGTPLQVWECGALGGGNQRFTRTRAGQLRFGASAMCAAINPSTNRLQLASCNTADSNQIFSFADGRIIQVSSGQCLDVQGPNDAQFFHGSDTAATGTPGNGAAVNRFTCNTALNQRWVFNGALRNDVNPALCLARGSDVDGAALTLQTCTGVAETQAWDYRF